MCLQKGGAPPLIPNVSIHYRWGVSFTPWPHCPSVNKPQYRMNRKLVGRRYSRDTLKTRKCLTHVGTERQFLDRTGSSLIVARLQPRKIKNKKQENSRTERQQANIPDQQPLRETDQGKYRCELNLAQRYNWVTVKGIKKRDQPVWQTAINTWVRWSLNIKWYRRTWRTGKGKVMVTNLWKLPIRCNCIG
jgi:hypothetical protein